MKRREGMAKFHLFSSPNCFFVDHYPDVIVLDIFILFFLLELPHKHLNSNLNISMNLKEKHPTVLLTFVVLFIFRSHRSLLGLGMFLIPLGLIRKGTPTLQGRETKVKCRHLEIALTWN